MPTNPETFFADFDMTDPEDYIKASDAVADQVAEHFGSEFAVSVGDATYVNVNVLQVLAQAAVINAIDTALAGENRLSEQFVKESLSLSSLANKAILTVASA